MSQSIPDGADPVDSDRRPEPTDGITRDELFDVLSNRRRRYALQCLRADGTGMSLGTLADQVAARETGQPVEEVSGTARKRVYTSLQQFHLPRLDDKGLVDFDSEAGVVELNTVAEELDVYLEVTDDDEFPWSVYYLGLAGLSSALVALSWLGVPPFAGISDGTLVVFVLTALTVFALTHTYLTRSVRSGREKSHPPETEPEQ